MPTPISDLIRAALTSSADAELYDELERRAEEALAYLDTPAADAELRTMFDGADAERLARLFEVLARGATLALGEPVPPSEEERSRVEAFLRAADEETGAAGRAFKDLLLPVLPGRLKDFESYFGALPEAAPEAQEGLLEQPDVEAARPEAEALVSRGLTPTTLLGATEAVSRLLTRSYRYGDLSPEATVRFVREEDHIAVSPAPLTERMLVEEIEDTCRCDEATARLLLRWVVEAAEHHMHLFRRLEAEAIPLRDSEQGVQLWRSTRRFNSLTEQWAQYEPTAA